jgi:hypothetical protein
MLMLSRNIGGVAVIDDDHCDIDYWNALRELDCGPSQ